MKTSRLHSLHRSFAHSAAAALIGLAAAVTSAAPAAAQAAPAGGHDGCAVSVKTKQGIESLLWTVVFGPSNTTKEQEHCRSTSESSHSEGSHSGGSQDGGSQDGGSQSGGPQNGGSRSGGSLSEGPRSGPSSAEGEA